MRPRVFKIYGVSHIVHSTDSLYESESYFNKIGYSLKFKTIGSVNALQKSSFIFGSMSEKADILLMSKKGYPDVEIKSEVNNRNIISKSAFETFYEENYTPDMHFPKDDKPTKIYIRCNNTMNATNIWSKLGFNIDKILSNNYLKVDIKNSISNNKVSLLYINSKEKELKTWLNQNNTVCISFICDDVEKVRSYLLKNNYSVGDVFIMTPFNRKIKVFFVRNYTGEIYEFISP